MCAALKLAVTHPTGIRSAADARQRLAQSELYRRREVDAARSRQESKLKALWYMSPKFLARWEAES